LSNLTQAWLLQSPSIPFAYSRSTTSHGFPPCSALLSNAISPPLGLILSQASQLPLPLSLPPTESFSRLSPNTLTRLFSAFVEFASGAGGPTPIIEATVNAQRKKEGFPALKFVLSDIAPNVAAWREHAKHSENISYVPYSVDAASPPEELMSHGAPTTDDVSKADHEKVFPLYCLSFHHFPDPEARRILQSTLSTSDGFAIIELVSRHTCSHSDDPLRHYSPARDFHVVPNGCHYAAIHLRHSHRAVRYCLQRSCLCTAHSYIRGSHGTSSTRMLIDIPAHGLTWQDTQERF
jgi:hypothetical protein